MPRDIILVTIGFLTLVVASELGHREGRGNVVFAASSDGQATLGVPSDPIAGTPR